MLGQHWSKYIQQKMWDLHQSSQKFYEDQSNSPLTSLSMGIWGSYKINCNTHSSHYEEVVYKVVEDRPALPIFYLSAQETLNQRDSCCGGDSDGRGCNCGRLGRQVQVLAGLWVHWSRSPLQAYENTHQGFLFNLKLIPWKVGLQFRYLENSAKSHDSSQCTLSSQSSLKIQKDILPCL